MEENKIGRFIRERRLELGLTQQQLADAVGVTDKAVSKWERSVSYPDITILRELADALHVSVTELLAGEKDGMPPVPPEVESVVVDTVAYAEAARKRNGGWRFWTFISLSAGCAIAALVLVICAIACDSRGCLRAVQCVAFGWAVCYPLLRSERHSVRNTLVVASLAVYPFIWCMGSRQVEHIGIVIVSVAYAWAVYWIFLRYWRRKPFAMALVVLLGGMLHISVNALAAADGFVGTGVITVLTLALGGLCLSGAWALERTACFMKR